MRKVLAIILTALFYSMLIIPASANDQVSSETDISILDILTRTNREIIDDFLDPSLFSESMADLTLEDQPMLVVFHDPLYCFTYDIPFPLDDSILNLYNEHGISSILLLGDNPVRLSKYDSWTKVGASEYIVQPFIQDILTGGVERNFLGEDCIISNVICFDSINSRAGAAILFETDKGLFVRYYEDENAEAIEYSWDSYVEIARPYFEYISSYEVNYDEFGNPKGGQLISLSEFAKNPSKYTNSEIDIHILVTSSAILLSTTLLVMFMLHKRKKH